MIVEEVGQCSEGQKREGMELKILEVLKCWAENAGDCMGTLLKELWLHTSCVTSILLGKFL